MIKVTILGCGASSGVPLIGCTCAVCTSSNPKNKRLRASIFVTDGTTSLLIDTSPDMRQQCLREDITKVDAIIYTHAHADHLHGIDDVRCFNHTSDGPVDAYSTEETLGQIAKAFSYVFLPAKPAGGGIDGWGWYRPCLNPMVVEPYKPFKIGTITVFPFEQQHGTGRTLGLRFGNFAYSTDVNGLTDAALEALKGVDSWVVDCLRYELAPTHAHLEMTLGWIAKVKPRAAYLTHMNHGFDYDTLSHQLPEGVFPAYDGLKLEIS